MIEDSNILSYIAAELTDSDIIQDTGLELESSLDYYLGNPNGREVEGRSAVVSTDVADAIEWIIPQVMKSFTQNNEIVIFDPVHQGDEKQADIESEYVYDVLMKQNSGFIAIHQFVKDALMQNNGILKVYYDDAEEVTTRAHTGIPMQEVEAILSTQGIELMEMTQYETMLPDGQSMQIADIKIQITKSNGKIVIESIPREDFRINSHHNSIDVSKARFTAHVVEKTVSDLVAQGYSMEQVMDYPEGTSYDYSQYRFAAQGEDVNYNDTSNDPSQRMIDVVECYTYMDIDEDGIAELVKITAVGGDNPTHILDIEEIDEMPWVTTTGILMSHKFRGLSIYDRLKQIQDQKTALWRNMFDNIYLQNNQRNVVVEGQVNMDDLLVSRPGGIIRAKRLDAIMPLATPQLGADAQNMMRYLDEVRAGRVGVSAEGAAAPQNIGDRVGSQGVDRLMSAKEELVGLIIRVIAETGIKPLMIKIRDESIKHVDSIKDFKFRGEWVQVHPTSWMERTGTTVRVGTGTGNHNRQVEALREVMALQEKALQAPGQILVGQQKIFNTIDDFCKFSELNGANRYFTDPDSPEGKQELQKVEKQQSEAKQKQDQMEQAMARSQMELAQAETKKAEAQMANVQLKAQSDQQKNQLTLMEDTHAAEMATLQAELEQAKLISSTMGKTAELDYKYWSDDQRNAIELTRIEKDSKQEENENFQGNVESIGG